MRKAAISKGARHQVSRTMSVAAPISGWNARDPYAAMKPTDAVILKNFFCLPSELMVRKGFSSHATGMTGTIETLAKYDPPSGSAKMFAAVGTAIYNATSAGAVGAAESLPYSVTNARWQHCNFTTSGGNFLVMCNGVDGVLEYNGTTWSDPAITGVTKANLVNVNAFKNRLFFVEKDTLKAWYLPTSSISGAASALDFGSIFTQGGYLMAMATWSLDAGYGLDDHAVFITSAGEVAIYKGTDPSDSTKWALVGVFNVGSPLGRRCFEKYAGDVVVICKDGLLPLSKGLMSSRVNTKSALTEKIQSVISAATTDYASNFGWQVTLYPPQNMLVINVPISSTISEQYVMNTISGAWSQFTGMNAASWEFFNEELYFGGDGVVYKAWDGTSDNGSNIDWQCLQAFNFFGSASQLKRFVMARPIVAFNTQPGLLSGINVDFDITAPIGQPTYTTYTTYTWDSGIWDASTWAGDLTINRSWQSVYGVGYSAAIHLKGASNNHDIRFYSTDYVFETGGVV